MGIEDLHRAGGEHGFALRSAAADHDVALRTFHRHMRRVGWDNHHPGLWVPTGHALTHTEQIAAALAVVRSTAVVTGASGLFLREALPDPPETVELLLPSGLHLAPHRDVCFHRTTTFEQVRYVHVAGMPVAAAPRLIADFAAHATFNVLCQVIGTALRLRLCTLDQIEAELRRRKRFPGRAVLRRALAALRGEVNHSGAERLGKRLLRAEGLRFGARPLTIEHNGRLLAEIDIPFAEIRYGAEIDGPHHLLPDVAAADRHRDRVLRGIEWTIDRFFWFEVEERGAWFVAQVAKAVGARS